METKGLGAMSSLGKCANQSFLGGSSRYAMWFCQAFPGAPNSAGSSVVNPTARLAIGHKYKFRSLEYICLVI